MFNEPLYPPSPPPSSGTTTNAHNTNDTSHSNKTWQDLKDEGKRHFRNENYTEALMSFGNALEQLEDEHGLSQQPSSTTTAVPASNNANMNREREILLSNSVACRLKIGGAEMAVVAVEEAKKCIALNDKWPKAHVRLASAYIALGNHSNDACQALQNAIRLDPTNSTAKQMLTKELRRDRRSSTTAASPTVVDETEYTHNNARPSAPPPPEYHDIDDDDDDDIDNHGTMNNHPPSNFLQRIQQSAQRFLQWYCHDANDNWKAFIRILMLIFVLYIAFGGRFGLESSLANRSQRDSATRKYDYDYDYAQQRHYQYDHQKPSGRNDGNTGGFNNYDNHNTYNQRNRKTGNSEYGGKMGNYGNGNAYDQFYNNRNFGRRETGSRYENSYDSRYGYDNRDRYRDAYGYESSYGNSYGRRNNHRNRSYSNNDWDAILPYILIIGGILLLNKMMGVPIHVAPMGFGMNRAFGINRGFGGIFGPRIRIGGGGINFGGFGHGFGNRYAGARWRYFDRRRGW